MRLTPEKELRKIHLPVAPFETPCNPKLNFSPLSVWSVRFGGAKRLCLVQAPASCSQEPSVHVLQSSGTTLISWPISEYRVEQFVLYFCCLHWPSKDVFLFHHWTLEHFPELYRMISGYKKHLSCWATLEKLFPEGKTWILQSSHPHKNLWIQQVHITNSMHFRIFSFSIMFNSVIKVNMLSSCNYPPTPSQVFLRLMAPGPVPWICWHHVVLTYSWMAVWPRQCILQVCQK